MNWIFANSRRAGALIVGAALAATLMAALVLGYRFHHLTGEMRAAGARPTPAVTAGAPLPLTGPAAVTATIAPTPPGLPDLGDPRPVVLEVVNAWIDGRLNDPSITGDAQPAALEDLTAHAPAAGLQINGTAVVSTPGPSASTVSVPTNRGDLLVDVVSSDGAWAVADLGWSR